MTRASSSRAGGVRIRRRLGAALAIALVSIAAGGCQSAEKKAQGYLESGDAYAARGEMAEAVIEYRNAVKATPEAAEAHARLGRAYLSVGKPVDALRALARAADLEIGNAAHQLDAGALQLLAGDAAGA